MRLSIVIFSLLACLIPAGRAQAQQSPDAQQDAEAAREKLLKAADQLDNIQANSEATTTSVAGMKSEVAKLEGDVSKLQSDNAALRVQLADLQSAFSEAKAAHEKEQKVMVDTIAGMIASSKGSGSNKPSRKKEKDAAATAPAKTPETAPAASSPAADTPSTTALTPPTDPAPAPVKTQKGYYHIVASGETLTLICNAYKQEGVNVTVSDVQRANSLTDKSVLKVGQKLFIPKPGT